MEPLSLLPELSFLVGLSFPVGLPLSVFFFLLCYLPAKKAAADLAYAMSYQILLCAVCSSFSSFASLQHLRKRRQSILHCVPSDADWRHSRRALHKDFRAAASIASFGVVTSFIRMKASIMSSRTPSSCLSLISTLLKMSGKV